MSELICAPMNHVTNEKDAESENSSENLANLSGHNAPTWNSEFSCNHETLADSNESNLANCKSRDCNSPGNSGVDVSPKIAGKIDVSKFANLSIADNNSGINLPVDGGDDSSWNVDNCREFYEAVGMGDSGKVEELLGNGAIEYIDEPNWNVSGDPPLLVAATNHCFDVLRVLLAKGCNAGCRSPCGETALHRVIINHGPFKTRKFVEELLRSGCSPCVKEAKGLTVLHIFVRQLAHACASRGAQQVDFQEALETLSILAKAGGVNERDHQGRNALHILASSTTFDNCRNEIKAVLEVLLASGADALSKNDRGETPLHEALECGALNTADLLIACTPIGLISRYGETPLHIASRKNYLEIVERLLSCGEDPSTKDAAGNTPMHLAAARGFHQIVSLLTNLRLVQLEATNDEGLTALQVAAESGFIDAVRVLIDAGADLTFLDDESSTHHRHPGITSIIHEERRKH